MIEIIQIILSCFDVAQELLWQSATETKCDVVIIAEPYRVPPANGNWVTDRSQIAAIQVMGRFLIQEVFENSYEGFVVAKINGVFVCNSYAPLRWSDEEYNRMLDAPTDTLNGRKPVVIEGNFGAWALEWSGRLTNTAYWKPWPNWM